MSVEVGTEQSSQITIKINIDLHSNYSILIPSDATVSVLHTELLSAAGSKTNIGMGVFSSHILLLSTDGNPTWALGSPVQER